MIKKVYFKDTILRFIYSEETHVLDGSWDYKYRRHTKRETYHTFFNLLVVVTITENNTCY